MKTVLRVLALSVVCALGLAVATTALATGGFCKRNPDHRKCQPTTTTTATTTTTQTETTPTTTTTPGPPTTTEPSPPTTTEPGPPSGTTGGTPPPSGDHPHTGAAWYWYAGLAAFLLVLGSALALYGPKKRSTP